MIFGNPDFFALQFEIINEWNVVGDIWRNGVFSMCVNGVRVFGFLDVVELKTTASYYKTLPKTRVGLTEESNPRDLYVEAMAYFYGEGATLREGVMSLVCTAMEDRSCFLYVMRQSANDIFFWSNDGGVTVTSFSCGTNFFDAAINDLCACSMLS